MPTESSRRLIELSDRPDHCAVADAVRLRDQANVCHAGDQGECEGQRLDRSWRPVPGVDNDAQAQVGGQGVQRAHPARRDLLLNPAWLPDGFAFVGWRHQDRIHLPLSKRPESTGASRRSCSEPNRHGSTLNASSTQSEGRRSRQGMGQGQL